MPGAELLTADEALYEALAGDAALVAELADGADGIYQGSVPDGGALPAVVFAPQTDGADVVAWPAHRVATGVTYLVKVVVEGRSFVPARAAAIRLDAVLNGLGPVDVDGGRLHGAVRVGPFRLNEDTATGKYRHEGGLYRLLVT